MPQCVGLLGGKPNFALYFVGYTASSLNGESHLIYLDPHFVQDAVNNRPMTKAQLASYFPLERSTAKKISMNALDPGIGIGLLIRNSDDLKQVKKAFSQGGKCQKLVTLHE